MRIVTVRARSVYLGTTPALITRGPGRLLAGPGGVNPEPPIPLPDHDVAAVFLLVGTIGGIGARSGVDAARAR
jgi:hypothetical protein